MYIITKEKIICRGFPAFSLMKVYVFGTLELENALKPYQHIQIP